MLDTDNVKLTNYYRRKNDCHKYTRGPQKYSPRTL